ncbi:hypothetical protein E3N88_13351 [Mikania micrantha]|uniref:AMMECR1 domain-containing protein n=1 Tax=Mikania micrantha TaxID=192012 RepID=A0A5N6P9Y6_9ASTR|nr:hypothetical protein E3N88_13351 [Mikania micrantha]
MVSANKEMVVYCFDTLVAHFNGEQVPPPAFDEGQHPLFVTWKKAVNGSEPRLRGCIGTLEARCIITGFKDYAIISALRDRRFPPIQAKELPFLQCTVSLLTNYEIAANYHDWEVGKHGIIIEFTDPDNNTKRSATYLPEIAAQEGWTKIEAIDSLMKKAGYNGSITESVRKRIQLTRYQSTLFTMHYSDYVSYVKKTREGTPSVAVSSDPDILTDYVLPPNTTVTDANYFTYTGVRSIVNATYPTKFTVVKASLKEFPGLLGQSVSYAVLEFPAGSINPLHIHPRAAELLFVIAGSLQVGFVDTTNTLFGQKLETGDMFVFPKGLVHFQYNSNSTEPALAVSAFGSASAGTQSIANSVFNSTIYNGILAESFKTTEDVVEKIESGLKS